MADDKKRNQEIMSRIVVKAWTDPDYVEFLKSNSRRALEEEGFEFEKGGDVEVVFHFDSEKTKNVTIPTPPDLLKLDRDDLLMIASQTIAIQLELF